MPFPRRDERGLDAGGVLFDAGIGHQACSHGVAAREVRAVDSVHGLVVVQVAQANAPGHELFKSEAGCFRTFVGVLSLGRVAKPPSCSRPHAGASRFGLEDELIDVHAKKFTPARVLIESMLSFLRPALEAQADRDEVSQLVRKTLDHGYSARRQLWAFAQYGRLEDVIDLILRETVQGL